MTVPCIFRYSRYDDFPDGNDLKDHRVLIGAPGKSPVRVGLLLAASRFQLHVAFSCM